MLGRRTMDIDDVVGLFCGLMLVALLILLYVEVI